MFAAMRRRPDVVSLLLEHGAAVGDHDKFGKKTALHYACEAGSNEVVELLLKAGSPILERDDAGMVCC